jgi:hypothetical protein
MKEQEHKSYLYQYIWGDDGWLTTTINRTNKENLFKKIDYSVILNSLLTVNDKAVYLAILYCISYTKNYKTKISSSLIESISGIIQQSQTRSIKKLTDAGIIEVFGSRYENKFLIIKEPRNFLPIKLEQFDNLKYNRKEYIRRLTGIILSSGNNQIPEYKTCLKKMKKLTNREFKKIKDNYRNNYDEVDVENYKRL